MTSQPESASGEPRKLTVRRAPKYVPFMIAGALAGIVTAAIFASVTPPNEQFETSSIFGFFAVLMVLPGAGLGAIVALVLDRASTRRSKTLLVTSLPDDDSNADGETA
ncbi:hypothetical protein [Arthrobacter glacialis]|uniref:hypothetical protein n=1 Tax=Arthrobacter glacialis TaxID=1664 RepID=UPI001A9C9DCD|nr:hypothetical protein [Arthrobacter glacialis]